jgi:transcriptional regulator with XRE-family HTH domain
MSRAATSEAYKVLIGALVERRKTAGVTQVELATALGKPQSYVSKIERRERRLDVLEFCAIARVLDMEPSELMASIEPLLPAALANEI